MEEESKSYSQMTKHSGKYLRKETILAAIDDLPDNEYQSITFIVKKRIFTSLHVD